MYKKFITLAAMSAGLTFGLGLDASATSLAPGVYLEDDGNPVYPVNQLTDFLITKINPSKNTLSAMYVNRSGLGLEKPFVVNITNGEIEDSYLVYLHSAAPGAMNRVYNNSTYWNNTPQFLDGVEENLTAEQLVSLGGQEVPISEHTKKELIYTAAINLGAGYWVAGRLDYSRCVNAPEYEEGMECRAEIMGDFVQYQPYKDGVRVEITEEIDDAKEELPDTNEGAPEVEKEIVEEITEPIKEAEDIELKMEAVEMELPKIAPVLPVAAESVLEITDFVPATERETLAVSDDASASDGWLYDSKTTDEFKEPEADEVNVPTLGFARRFGWLFMLAAILVAPMIWWFLVYKRRKRKEDEES